MFAPHGVVAWFILTDGSMNFMRHPKSKTFMDRRRSEDRDEACDRLVLTVHPAGPIARLAIMVCLISANTGRPGQQDRAGGRAPVDLPDRAHRAQTRRALGVRPQIWLPKSPDGRKIICIHYDVLASWSGYRKRSCRGTDA